MPLFPQLSPKFYSSEDRPMRERLEYAYAQSIIWNQSFWAEADLNTRFEAGDQEVFAELYGNVPALGRRNFTFNHIRPIINMIHGHQSRNRKSTIVVPVEGSDESTADQFTKILMHVNRQEGVYETISEAFRGALVTGMNFLHVYMDYRSDPINGEMKVDCCPYNSFLVDPFFRKPDMSDCNYIWRRSFLSPKDIVALMPEQSDQILDMVSSQGTHDNKFQFMPENYNYSYKDLMTYDEYYYKDYRTQNMLVDTETGDTMEWRSKDKEKLGEFLEFYPQIRIQKQQIPTFRLALIVQGRVLYDGPNPNGIDSLPLIPVLGYYNPQLAYYPYRIQGVVTSLRDPQFLFNRRMIILLDILESQINSGFIYKENALVNPDDVFLTGQGRGLPIKEDASINDVMQIQAPNIPPASFQIAEILGNEMFKVSGANEELMGAAMDDKAGVLSMLRQGAGLTTLQPLFDRLDFSQKLLGKRMIELIQVNWTPGKIQRLLNEQPADLFYNKSFGKYDAAVEEGINTTTQRQMQFAQLIHLKELGLPIPDDVIIKAATLQDKKELIESMEAKQKQEQEMQQKQMQLQEQQIQSQIELAQARAVADKGLGIERLSRVDENQALAKERLAEAAKDREVGLLNLVKALKEVQNVDLAQIEKIITLANMVKQEETELKQEPQANMFAEAQQPQQPQQNMFEGGGESPQI